MPMFPKNNISSQVAGNVKIANAINATSKNFKKSPNSLLPSYGDPSKR